MTDKDVINFIRMHLNIRKRRLNNALLKKPNATLEAIIRGRLDEVEIIWKDIDGVERGITMREDQLEDFEEGDDDD